jgi:5-methyltetrahydrofolate--homocysteine methyltransferase
LGCKEAPLTFSSLVKALSKLAHEESINEVQKLVSAGEEPFEIIEKGIMQGMDIVGEKFQSGEYFLPELLLAARAVEACSSIVKPLIKGDQGRSKGTIVMGTVAGDIHDLGKNIVITTLKSGGFRVVDAGVDVPVEEFVRVVRDENACILGISALLTVTMVRMEEVIKALHDESGLAHVKVMIGGAPVDQKFAERIGADAYGKDARDALVKARELAG